MSTFYGKYAGLFGGGGGSVTSINGLTGAVVFAAGTNITLVPVGNTITINATVPLLTLGAFDGQAATANGLALVANVLYAQSADATHPGMVNTGAQVFAGIKTFNSSPLVPTAAALDNSTKAASTAYVDSAVAVVPGAWKLVGNAGTTAGTNFVGTTDAKDLVFKTNSVEAMRVQNGTNNVGIGTSSPITFLFVKSAINSVNEGIGIQGVGNTDYYSFATIANGAFYFRNPFQNLTYMNADNAGNIAWGAANANGTANLDAFIIQNHTGTNVASATFSLVKQTSQTGDFLDAYDTDGLTKLAKIDISGKGFFSNLRDTALSTGIVHSNASGDFTSSAVSLSSADVSGILPLANGGTNNSAAASAGAVIFSDASKHSYTAVGTSGQVLTSAGAGTPTWTTPTTGTVTSVAATVPAFLSIAGSPITTSGTLAITLSGTALPIANGGTAATTAAAAFNNLNPMTTTGDTIYESAANVASRLAIGATGNVLTVAGGVPVWAAPATNGTVTSVALTLPSFLSVAGSPITSSGTLAVTLATETANTVFAGPASGAAAAPTFRALNVADQVIATQAIGASAIDWSTGFVFTKSIGSTNTTFTFSNKLSGQTIVVRITATTGTVTWPTVKWSGGAAPTQTANGTDVYTFVYDGTDVYGSAVQNMS